LECTESVSKFFHFFKKNETTICEKMKKMSKITQVFAKIFAKMYVPQRNINELSVSKLSEPSLGR
jgi:hypothetical protein